MADQQVPGEVTRMDFRRKMFLPLAALLFAGNNMNIIGYTIWVSFFFFLIVFFSGLECNLKASFKWIGIAFRSSPSYAVLVIGYVLCVYEVLKWHVHTRYRSEVKACISELKAYARILDNEYKGITNSSEMPPIPECISLPYWSELVAAWEGVMISAALTYIILIYCLSTSRQKDCPFPGDYNLLLLSTAFALYYATGAGVVKIESLVVYFKTVSLVALLCCAPHLYPGLNSLRSTVVTLYFYLVVLPLTLVGIWLLMEFNIASNDTIIAKVDVYKYCIGAIYLALFCWEILLWMIEYVATSDYDLLY